MSTENIKQPVATDEAQREARFAASGGCAALLEWLRQQTDEDDLAMINARDHGEWSRHDALQGHRSGMVHVIHHIRAMQHNNY